MKPLNRIFIFLLLLLSVAKPSSAGRVVPNSINRSSIREIEASIRNGDYGKVTSIVVLNRQGAILYEKYFGFSTRNSLHTISSVTKSITSLMVGICLDKGFISSIDSPIYSYFPEYKEVFEKDSTKKLITLRHLLQQTAGLNFKEWQFPYNYASNSLMAAIEENRSWVERFFYLPVDTLPGVKFSYNSLASQVIAEVLSRASGIAYDEMVREFLFKPLSIGNFLWESYAGNSLPAWGGLSLTTFDMAKIGLLVINGGIYGGRRLVSSEWVESSTAGRVRVNDNIYYGLHWWVDILPSGKPLPFAAGYGDQYVFTAPDRGLVVALNAQNFSDFRFSKSAIDLANILLSSVEVENFQH